MTKIPKTSELKKIQDSYNGKLHKMHQLTTSSNTKESSESQKNSSSSSSYIKSFDD